MFKGLGEKLSDAKAKVADAVESASGSTDKIKELVGNTLQDVNDLRPILAEAGFTIGDIVLTAGIPPSFGLVIDQSEGERRSLGEILEDESLELSGFQSSILGGLKRIYDLNDMVESKGHTIRSVHVEIGITPKVKAHLRRLDGTQAPADTSA